jgi:hypothetical protein
MLALVALTPALAASRSAPAPAPPSLAPRLEDSPGWYPPADPESASVRIGRRLGAPRVAMRFMGGARSVEELARLVLRAIHRSDADSLRALCVTREELEGILWREFPQSRPATGLTVDDAWGSLERRFAAGINGVLHEHGGRPLRLARIERHDTVAVYENFRLHNGLRLVVINEAGREETLPFVRAVAERKGRFKIQSTTD